MLVTIIVLAVVLLVVVLGLAAWLAIRVLNDPRAASSRPRLAARAMAESGMPPAGMSSADMNRAAASQTGMIRTDPGQVAAPAAVVGASPRAAGPTPAGGAPTAPAQPASKVPTPIPTPLQPGPVQAAQPGLPADGLTTADQAKTTPHAPERAGRLPGADVFAAAPGPSGADLPPAASSTPGQRPASQTGDATGMGEFVGRDELTRRYAAGEVDPSTSLPQHPDAQRQGSDAWWGTPGAPPQN